MTQSTRYFTKKLLAKANAVAVKRGYNRALRDEFISKLPDTVKFPIVSDAVHSHKGGRKCEQHVRVSIAYGIGEGEIVVLDCDWNLFHKLPVAKLGDQSVSVEDDAMLGLGQTLRLLVVSRNLPGLVQFFASIQAYTLGELFIRNHDRTREIYRLSLSLYDPLDLWCKTHALCESVDDDLKLGKCLRRIFGEAIAENLAKRDSGKTVADL
jgi:hypothetical protein